MRRVVCIIDCCRADEVRLIPEKKDCRRVVLRSSEGRTTASPTNGSTFTRYYLAGLRSARRCPCAEGVSCQRLQKLRENSSAAGFITLANLFSYVAEHMEDQNPRQDVISYKNSNHVHEPLAFFNLDPIVYSIPLVVVGVQLPRNKQLNELEMEEQKIDFKAASLDDINEQLRQEILSSVLFGQGRSTHYRFILLVVILLTLQFAWLNVFSGQNKIATFP